MPGQVCAVVNCKNNRLLLKKQGSSITFHSFPKANNAISSKVRKEWIQRCGRKDKINPCTSRICSLHFTDEDFERDLKHELLGLPLRRFLKNTAVPSQNLSVGLENLYNTAPPTKKLEKRKKTSSILTETKLEGTTEDVGPFLDINESSVIYCLGIPKMIKDENQPSSSFDTGMDYKQKYEELLLQFNQSRAEITRLKKKAEYYKTQLYLQSILSKNHKLTMAEKILNKVLTKNQISLFAAKKKRVCSTNRKKVYNS